jgi:hypothetical protein
VSSKAGFKKSNNGKAGRWRWWWRKKKKGNPSKVQKGWWESHIPMCTKQLRKRLCVHLEKDEHRMPQPILGNHPWRGKSQTTAGLATVLRNTSGRSWHSLICSSITRTEPDKTKSYICIWSVCASYQLNKNQMMHKILARDGTYMFMLYLFKKNRVIVSKLSRY